MERNNSQKDLVQVYAEGQFYLEWTEVCEVVGLPRTTLQRTIDRFELLTHEDVFYYKNRKLIKRDWAFNFWRLLSEQKRK